MPKKLTFEEWMKAVDIIVMSISGVGVYDLPDCTYRDWYDDECTPREAAEWALEYAGFPF